MDNEECSCCRKSMSDIRKVYKSEKHLLCMHVDYWALGQSGKKSRVDEDIRRRVNDFKDLFFKNVCSLRNSRGGVLAIHVQNMGEDVGPSLDVFDERVSADLSAMIEDDTPYTYNFVRRWYDSEDDKPHQQAKYIIVLVKGSSAVSTKCFNTLVPFDGSKERPRAREVAKFLSHDAKFGECSEKGIKRCLKEGKKVDFIESRSIQFKHLRLEDLQKDNHEHPELKSLPSTLVFRLIEKLNLLHYITTFTKIKDGGSFFLGIEEEKKKCEGFSCMICKPMTLLNKQTKTHKSQRRLEFSDKSSRKDGEKWREREHHSRCGKYRTGRDTHQKHRQRSRSPVRTRSRSKSVDRRTTRYPTTDKERSTERQSKRRYETFRHKQQRTCPELTVPTAREYAYGDRASTSALTDQPTKPKSPSSTPGTPSSQGKEHRTGHNVVRGVRLATPERRKVRELLEKQIAEKMMWLKWNESELELKEIKSAVEINFHDTNNSGKCVIEVRVKERFPGLVFFTKFGPEAYRLEQDRNVPITVREWMKMLTRASKCSSCLLLAGHRPENNE